MNDPVQIEWTREKLKALRDARDDAMAKRQTEFKLKLPGEAAELEFLTAYASYTIDYLDWVFRTNPDQPRRPNKEGQEGQ